MNKPPPPSSSVLQLLDAFDISIDEVADSAQVQPALATAALRSRSLEACPVIVLIKVKTAAEMLLRDSGWQGDRALVWQEFYAMLAQAGKHKTH